MSNATITVTLVTTIASTVTSQDAVISLLVSLFLPVAATGSAIGALLTAYFNYRSRPVLMRSVERHSEDLRQIAFAWAQQLPLAGDLEEIGKPYIDTGLVEPEPVHTVIEDEFLFEDLRNHVPKEIPLLDHWREYKIRLHDFRTKRFALWSEMSKEISSRTGLQIDPNFQKGLSTYAIRAVYNGFFKELTAGSKRWKDYINSSSISGTTEKSYLTAQGDGLAVGNSNELCSTRDVLVKMICDIPKEIGDAKYSDWKDRAKKLLSEKEELDKDANRLLREIRDFSYVPIVPGKCKYIKWATNE
jgi:hypothetical protein